jgi:hypothetical protein
MRNTVPPPGGHSRCIQPSACFDDAIDGGQAQPGALADRLGGEERLPDLFAHLQRNAGPVVGHLDQRHLARARGGVGIAQLPRLGARQPRRADLDHPAALRAHRVARIDRQVHDGVFQRRLVGPHQRQVAAVIGLQLDVLAQEPPQQDLGFADQLAQLQRLALHGPLARKIQQLAHQVGGPKTGLADLVQAAVRRVADRMALQQLVETKRDRRQ